MSEQPVLVQVVDPSQHLIAGRGKSFGGIVGLTLDVISWGVWAYLWAVAAASVIYFVRSDYDIFGTLENTLRLAIHPFIAVPMHLFVVWPYKYIYCPLNLWWAELDIKIPIPFFPDSHPKTGITTWNELSPDQKTDAMQDYAKKNSAKVTALNDKLEKVWVGDPELNQGQPWQDPIKWTYHSTAFGVRTYDWEWSLPPNSPERVYLNTVYQDLLQPVYDKQHGYTPPKYCKLPGEPWSAGCDPFQNGLDPSWFSLSYWFCRKPTLQHCTINCVPRPK